MVNSEAKIYKDMMVWGQLRVFLRVSDLLGSKSSGPQHFTAGHCSLQGTCGGQSTLVDTLTGQGPSSRRCCVLTVGPDLDFLRKISVLLFVFKKKKIIKYIHEDNHPLNMSRQWCRIFCQKWALGNPIYTYDTKILRIYLWALRMCNILWGNVF